MYSLRSYLAIATTSLCLFLLPTNAEARKDRSNKRTKNDSFETCPYSGPPMVDGMAGDNLAIANTTFKLSRTKHYIAFQQLLAMCNAQAAAGPLNEWKTARLIAAAKGAEAAAYAISATARALNAESEKEKQAIIADAAAVGARLAAELVPLTADAVAKKQMFLAAFMATSSPE